MSDLALGVLQFLLFIPAVVLHEYAHGWVSYKLGDPTAKMAGRLTLNPIKHVDPIGTVVLPAVMALGGGPVFGYAKGVPINPNYYKDYRKGMMISGLAGPATSVLLTLLSVTVFWAVYAATGVAADGMSDSMISGISWLLYGLQLFALLNLSLTFFNLIPIPPLDGSRVLPLFLSDRALQAYHRFERQGMLVFIVVVFLLPRATGIDLIGSYFDLTVFPIFQLLFGLS